MARELRFTTPAPGAKREGGGALDTLNLGGSCLSGGKERTRKRFRTVCELPKMRPIARKSSFYLSNPTFLK